jgi:hypothetical protein
LNLYKIDKLGAQVRYSILFTSHESYTPVVESLVTISKELLSEPIVVCDSQITNKCRVLTYEKFFDSFGGLVNTGLVLIPNLPIILKELGHNKLPNGLEGEPEDLLEIYIKECLQFIFESPTRRYGKDRLFESLPDGVVIGKNRTIV